MENNKKKALVLSIVGVVTLILVVVGATYAYFTAQGGTGANADINTQTYTTDNLSFQVGNAISIEADQTNFAQGAGNREGSTYARAILTANNKTNTATMNYYVYLDITENDFEYTTVDNQAELLLKITSPTGEVTTINGLDAQVTSGGETGFDITTKTGLITIADNYEIISTGTETQEWQVEVILVNLDSDQNENTGKTFSATLIIQEEKINLFAEYIASLYTTDGENGLYYHDADLTNGANDNSYRYAGANPNNYVCFGSDEESCRTDNLYRIIGVFDGQVKLIKADFAGESVLGTAPAGNVQISSYPNYKGSLNELPYYYWSGSSSNQSNTWSASTLNTGVLNGTYLTVLESEWTDKIATTNWIVGGNTYDNIMYTSPANAYQNEIANPAESTTYSAKIGLMYVSDYMYGAAPTYWTYHGYTTSSHPNEEGQYGAEYDYRAAINDNWMYMGLYEWTISRDSAYASSAFFVNNTGTVYNYNVSGHYGVRPSFYLESSVEFLQGDGTEQSPYRIKI